MRRTIFHAFGLAHALRSLRDEQRPDRAAVEVGVERSCHRRREYRGITTAAFALQAQGAVPAVVGQVLNVSGRGNTRASARRPRRHTGLEDGLARVPGRVLRVSGHVSAPCLGSRTRWCGALRRPRRSRRQCAASSRPARWPCTCGGR